MPVILTPQSQIALVEANQSVSYDTASGDGHRVLNEPGREPSLYILNNGVGDVVVTVKSLRRSSFGVFPDKTFTAWSGALTVSPRWAVERFSDERTGMLEFTLSATTNVFVAAVLQERYFKES